MIKCQNNQLTIETSTQDNQLVIKITDTGCGISQKDLLHLFEPFFSTKVNGTGLGLTIVKKIIENHNGKITVESEVGRGTTTLVSLLL